MVSVIRSSEVEEKEALKSLPLEGKRRFLPKVRFLVGGVLTQAAPAVRACFGGVLGMLAPGSRKEVEALGAIWTGDQVGARVHGSAYRKPHANAYAWSKVARVLTAFPAEATRATGVCGFDSSPLKPWEPMNPFDADAGVPLSAMFS
jgi:hypothetical protein